MPAHGALEIDIEEGGARLIRVRDDGVGIDVEDLPLAISAHATSKIASFEDLERVGTLGFRGEALPSIASVSRFALTSRTADAESATRIEVDGGKPHTQRPAQHAPGTSVEIRDLFYNLPARRKFMRAERTEFNHIDDLVKSIALARDSVEIRLGNNGKIVRLYKPTRGAEDASRRVAGCWATRSSATVCASTIARQECDCLVGWDCRRRRARRRISSIFMSMDASCEIGSLRTPCAGLCRRAFSRASSRVCAVS